MHELENLSSIEVAKVKRKRRKTKQRKAKDIERMQKHMMTQYDIGLEQVSGMEKGHF